MLPGSPPLPVVSPATLRFLPVLSRQGSWVALLAPADAHIVGYLAVDGFF